MDALTSRDFFLGLFFPLMPLSIWAAAMLWRMVGIPALVSDRPLDNSLGIGTALIATALSAESIVYGLVRWFPYSMAWINNQWEVVAAIKAGYVLGMVLIAVTTSPEEERPRRFLVLSGLTMMLYAMGVLVSWLVL